ncbi:hypothetical protein MLD38_011040 [Melastoma candidum]|uniref:Uncharacterized protein n=1 Tax=Melastoma candidum TaxID=119954 RepID=A0ACB9R198_9MYRT|nr:hypothetical protein MLD38_011040 [Melastoma candidum]
MEVKIVEEYEVRLPTTVDQETTERALSLSFLDLPWLFFPPSQPLFLFHYPHSLPNFLSAELPALKRSLSLCLFPFSPFSGQLSLSPRPSILFSPVDRVLLTVAESSSDFHYLSTSHPRDARDFECLVPSFPASAMHLPLPLLAIQVTLFPGSAGLSIGLAYHHVVGDGRTFDHFLRAWSALCRSQLSGLPTLTLPPPWPCLDRTAISDPGGLESTFLHELELWRQATDGEWPIGLAALPSGFDLQRATFLVTPTDMADIKRGIIARCDSIGQPHPIYLSPYVLACTLLWVAWVRTHFLPALAGGANGDNRPVYFGFIAGGNTRMEYSVPRTYVGNFVGFGRAKAISWELLGDDGTTVAAREIGATIKKLDKDALGEAKTWISDWKLFWDAEEHVIMVGSPKVALYDVDFGWGRPVKIEDLSIDMSRRKAISLMESRNFKGGIEAGVVLPRDSLRRFASHFKEALSFFTQ